MLHVTVSVRCPMCNFTNYEDILATSTLTAITKKCGIKSDGGSYGCGKRFLIEMILKAETRTIILETVKDLYKKKKGSKK